LKIEKPLAIILLLFSILLFLSNYSKKETLSIEIPKAQTNFSVTNFTKMEIDTKGFLKVKVNVDAIYLDRAQITLTAGCYQIQATTDACVGEAILKGLEKKIDFRPTVYDVIADTFKSLGIEVLALKIVEVRNNTFIGELIVQQGDKVLSLDIRPSDGTAIALRLNSPIYINETLAKEMGKNIC